MAKPTKDKAAPPSLASASQAVPPASHIQTTKAVEDLAKLYRDQFASAAGTTGTTLIGWTAALLIVLVQSVLPVALKVKAVVSKNEQADKIVETTILRGRGFRNSFVATPPERRAANVSAANVQKQLSTVRDESARLFADLQKIKTPLGEIELPAWYVPPLYSLLVAGFIVYFMRRRLVLNTMALRALHLNLETLGRSVSEIRGFGAWAPFWLAPLPRIEAEPGATVDEKTASEARIEFFGWKHYETLNTGLVALILAAAGGVWVWVLSLARKLDAIRPSGPTWLHWELHALLFLAGVIFSVLYVKPAAIWGAFPERLAVETKSRRAFLTAALVAVGAFIGISVLPQRFAHFLPTLRVPRFRRRWWRQQAPLQNVKGGLFVNHHTKVVHAVDASGWVVRRRLVAEQNLVPVTALEVTATYVGATKTFLNDLVRHTSHDPNDLREVGPPLTAQVKDGRSRHRRNTHLDCNSARFVAEQLALNLARQGKDYLPLALQLLWTAMLDDARRFAAVPSYRLYDFYSGLLFRAGSSAEALGDFSDLIQTRWPNDARMLKILSRLKSPSERWRRRWSGAAIDWTVPHPTKTTRRSPLLRIFRRKRERRRSFGRMRPKKK